MDWPERSLVVHDNARIVGSCGSRNASHERVTFSGEKQVLLKTLMFGDH